MRWTARGSLCPQGDSNPCFGLERATSWAARRWGQRRRLYHRPCRQSTKESKSHPGPLLRARFTKTTKSARDGRAPSGRKAILFVAGGRGRRRGGFSALPVLPVSARAALPGGGTVIGGVEPGAFEDDAYRRVNLVQALFPALRAARQRWIAEFLLSFELYATVITAVRIDWHSTLTSYLYRARIRLT